MRLVQSGLYLLLALALALPAVAASGSAGAHTLNIFGNANMDDRLDEEDISYLQGIIDGRNKPTNLDDANNDGLVDSKDIDQIKKVMSGEADSLTILDAQNRTVTLELPIEKAVGVNTGAIEIMRDIGVDLNKVFMVVSSYALENPDYFPELKDKVSNKYGSPDYEALARLKPDLVILYKKPYKDESFDKYDTIGVPVISWTAPTRRAWMGASRY